MFVALRENGDYISLAEKWKRSDLLELRKDETFLCPACKSKVQLKAGMKKTHHFAHLKGAECTVKTEPESEYHLDGKRQLFNWFQAQGYDVKLEPFLPEISQRPDLLVTIQEKRYAIEYQCSGIDFALFKKRSDSYQKIGIIPFWILGAKWFKRMTTYSVRLSSFQWLFATSFNQPIPPSILFYCPNASTFIKLSNILPFTTSEAFSSIHFYKENAVSFSRLIAPNKTTFPILPSWIRKKHKWRATYSVYSSSNLSTFLNTLYENRIPPSLLPGEAGVPLPSGYWFHTSPMVWQMWLLLDLLLPLKIDTTFFFSNAMGVISKRISSNDLVIKQLPLVFHSQYSQAVEEYLQFLASVGILTQLSKTKYRKIGDFQIPTTLDMSLRMDEIILKKSGNSWKA